jgi:Predicted membrane protein (DUF2142)
VNPVIEQKTEALDGRDSRIKERSIVMLLCLLAGIHVFIFSAAFPLFNINDEAAHYDLVLKYSHGDIPSEMAPMSEEWMRYFALFGSQEYFFAPEFFEDKTIPPPLWTQPIEQAKSALLTREKLWRKVNHESSQPPLYYAIAGAWWDIGKLGGFHDGYLLYWVRFLDVILVGGLVWLGYAAGRAAFPEKAFVRLGVPALLAFMPQTVFYSVTNDILSPITFGAAFLCLIYWWRAEMPKVSHGLALGAALVASFLTKMCNVPLIGIMALFLVMDAWRRAKAGTLRLALPSFVAMGLCSGIPATWWVIRCRRDFGDFTGSEEKIRMLGWTHKPVGEWIHHPIFSPKGMWVFCHDLLASLWRGEFLWHRQPLASATVDNVFVFFSVAAIGFALVNLCRRSAGSAGLERQVLWFCFLSAAASALFLAYLSIIYDFHDCFYPSREHPYFTSGRLMLGAVIPFLTICLYGIDCALQRVKVPWVRPSVQGCMIVFMLAGELAVDWPVFFSRYNWFHLAG